LALDSKCRNRYTAKQEKISKVGLADERAIDSLATYRNCASLARRTWLSPFEEPDASEG